MTTCKDAETQVFRPRALPNISKKLANKMIFLVVLVLSDQWPNSGPDRRPLKLKADRANPRK